MDYQEKCQKPIPIGKQLFAYQCENVSMEPVSGSINIRGWKPFKSGKEPYPNDEKELIDYYDLRIGRFTGNSIEIFFTKNFKDKSQELYLTNVSFSELVNRLFAGHPVNIWKNEPPVNRFNEST
jgi:hypothetical protein